MNRNDIAQQTLVENQMLNYLIEGLRSTMAWQVEGSDCSRKLSTLRFIAQSFQRHLEHIFALEEFEGYMDLVLRTSPTLGKNVDALKLEHDQFRGEVRQIVQRLERVAPSDLAAFDNICRDLHEHLQRLDAHHRNEVGLIQEAFEREGGGEG